MDIKQKSKEPAADAARKQAWSKSSHPPENIPDELGAARDESAAAHVAKSCEVAIDGSHEATVSQEAFLVDCEPKHNLGSDPAESTAAHAVKPCEVAIDGSNEALPTQEDNSVDCEPKHSHRADTPADDVVMFQWPGAVQELGICYVRCESLRGMMAHEACEQAKHQLGAQSEQQQQEKDPTEMSERLAIGLPTMLSQRHRNLEPEQQRPMARELCDAGGAGVVRTRRVIHIN